MIVKTLEQTLLTEKFLDDKFANAFMGDKRTLRIGNIISFLSPLKFDKQKKECEQAINFCIEIPEISNYAGACFQKLFITNVANILTVKHVKEPVEVRNDDIIIKKEHLGGGVSQIDGVLNFNYITKTKDNIMILLSLYNKLGDNSNVRSIALNLPDEMCYPLMDKIN